jgi:single-stranded DNA-binding protein
MSLSLGGEYIVLIRMYHMMGLRIAGLKRGKADPVSGLSPAHQRPSTLFYMLKTILTGSVGSVKLVQTTGKSSVLNINIATNRRVGEREYVDWTSAKVWGDRAEKLSPYVVKGAKLLVTGRPEARAFKKSDGTPGAELVLHIEDLEFLGGRGQSGHDAHLDDGTVIDSVPEVVS